MVHRSGLDRPLSFCGGSECRCSRCALLNEAGCRSYCSARSGLPLAPTQRLHRRNRSYRPRLCLAIHPRRRHRRHQCRRQQPRRLQFPPCRHRPQHQRRRIHQPRLSPARRSISTHRPVRAPPRARGVRRDRMMPHSWIRSRHNRRPCGSAIGTATSLAT